MRALVIVACAVSGCAISFDGYELAESSASASGASSGSGGASTASTVGSGGGATATSGSAGGGNEGGAGASGAAGGGGTSASVGGGGTGGMPTQCPGAMIEIPGAGYCVDPTEVTEAGYQAFLATNPDPAGQIGVCTTNSSFAPTCNFDPANDPEHPVVCVDWCDAYAFCDSVGKRLCGKIGGGSNATAAAADAAQSQWYRACSEAGARVFPYGDTYDGDKCNGLDGPFTGPIDVGLLVQCAGGYPGLLDMSGNAREWEDSCDAGGCVQRGGSWLDSDTSVPHSLRCDSAGKGPRSQANNEIGFRCCADLP